VPVNDRSAGRASPSAEAKEIVVPTGRFRIYLGSAAGVGKTCAMLDEGWRRHERGADVVIGYVETHGREHTQEMVRSLPAVPRKVVEYRGTTFTEMDVAAVLARKPAVALVDELAHTIVPGASDHEKRWEDIFTLLEAGIAVISTLNVQHIESIADAVERFTGAVVRERVPDWVVRRADQLELIDSSPEQLRRRMLHGNIYPPDKVTAALSGFFQTKNLVALRELALRYVADETDESLLGYLQDQPPDKVSDITERVLVVVSGKTNDDVVVRRAARIALRIKCSLLVALVREGEGRADLKTVRAELTQLAESVGGRLTDVATDDLVGSIMHLATTQQITQLVLPASPKGRFGGLGRSSPLVRLLPAAAAAGIDVHLISPDQPVATGGGAGEDDGG
jgi:two-component system, OmpR family, sensor histidine kinase KdpD